MANGDVYEFRWRVPRHGYEWVQACPEPSPGAETDTDAAEWLSSGAAIAMVLTPAAAAGKTIGELEYSPMDHPALFRAFATLPQERDSITKFANQWGGLVGTETQSFRYMACDKEGNLLSAEKGGRGAFFAETFGSWTASIELMGRAVVLWDLVEANDTAGLTGLAEWLPGKPGSDPWPQRALEDQGDVRQPKGDGWLRWFKSYFFPYRGNPENPSDIRAAAAAFVRTVVNTALHHGVSVVLEQNPATGAYAIAHKPNSLRTALWLQFAQSISGDKKQRRCKECGTWFEVSRDERGFTERRLFCSDPCKSKDYRTRKQRAQELRAKGKTPKAIAKELDTDIKTINTWVSKRKG